MFCMALNILTQYPLRLFQACPAARWPTCGHAHTQRSMGTRAQFVTIDVHPDWLSQPGALTDVAIITLDKCYYSGTKVARLGSAFVNRAGSHLWAVGAGHTELQKEAEAGRPNVFFGSTAATTLQQIRTSATTIGRKTIATSVPGSGSVCQGDSGGPLYQCPGKGVLGGPRGTEECVQVGLTSANNGCQRGSTAWYVHVAGYMNAIDDFITSRIASSKCGSTETQAAAPAMAINATKGKEGTGQSQAKGPLHGFVELLGYRGKTCGDMQAGRPTLAEELHFDTHDQSEAAGHCATACRSRGVGICKAFTAASTGACLLYSTCAKVVPYGAFPPGSTAVKTYGVADSGDGFTLVGSGYCRPYHCQGCKNPWDTSMSCTNSPDECKARCLSGAGASSISSNTSSTRTITSTAAACRGVAFSHTPANKTAADLSSFNCMAQAKGKCVCYMDKIAATSGTSSSSSSGGGGAGTFRNTGAVTGQQIMSQGTKTGQDDYTCWRPQHTSAGTGTGVGTGPSDSEDTDSGPASNSGSDDNGMPSSTSASASRASEPATDTATTLAAMSTAPAATAAAVVEAAPGFGFVGNGYCRESSCWTCATTHTTSATCVDSLDLCKLMCTSSDEVSTATATATATAATGSSCQGIAYVPSLRDAIHSCDVVALILCQSQILT